MTKCRPMTGLPWLIALAAMAWPTLGHADGPYEPTVTSIGPMEDAAPILEPDLPTDERVAHGVVLVRRPTRTHHVHHHHHIHHREKRPLRRIVLTTKKRGVTAAKSVPPPPADDRSVLALGARVSALSLGDTAVPGEIVSGETLAGVGGYVRGRVSDHAGLELSIDYMRSVGDGVDQTTVPILAAVTAHAFADSDAFDLYALLGGGALLSAVAYPEVTAKNGVTRRFSEDYTQMAGQLGAGVELELGGLHVVTDLRYLLLEARPERDAELREVLLEEASSDDDTFGHGVHIQVGVGALF